MYSIVFYHYYHTFMSYPNAFGHSIITFYTYRLARPIVYICLRNFRIMCGGSPAAIIGGRTFAFGSTSAG